MTSESGRLFCACLIWSSCAQSLYMDVVLKANECRVPSSAGKGAAKSLMEPLHDISYIHFEMTWCAYSLYKVDFNHHFTARSNLFAVYRLLIAV